ncbi:hypothetical protein AOC40_13135 [Listeria monocytogenes]|nr:hypothetical protein [Listeria monocytogenes]EAC5437697.1 hypothetical protein [Listeria monocytogenes]EAD1191625.1 hypothetical protein [Listeria monocytogenes]EAD1420389.1 hypothetical protein [Listeria monocytogenes]EAD5400592.1 hypothetical protein [Listeria monocytogenes]
MPDVLICLLIANIIIIIFFQVFSDNTLKKYRNTYIMTVFLIVFMIFGLYEYYAIKGLFN